VFSGGSLALVCRQAPKLFPTEISRSQTRRKRRPLRWEGNMRMQGVVREMIRHGGRRKMIGTAGIHSNERHRQFLKPLRPELELHPDTPVNPWSRATSTS
jgi:hypothetical protein